MAGWMFNLSPDRVNVPKRDWSGISDLAEGFQEKRANTAATEAAGQYAQGLTPEQIAQVAPMLKDPQLRGVGIKQIMEWRKPKEYDVQIAPDGTPLRIDEQAGTIEKLAGNYARPREPSQASQNTPQARAVIAEQYGLTPGSAEHQRYVLTGSLPASDRGVTAGDREAIREADDAVQSGAATTTLIDKALELSGKAYEGPTAALRARVAGPLGDPAALATLEYDNIVTEQALGQMKSIFGGNPTEGERQILLDIQGSSGKPASVRQAILERARKAIENKMLYNRDKASDLRGGGYYKADRNAAPASDMPQPGAEVDGYIFRGGDPADQKNWIKRP